jgi:hypothetical protein
LEKELKEEALGHQQFKQMYLQEKKKIEDEKHSSVAGAVGKKYS